MKFEDKKPCTISPLTKTLASKKKKKKTLTKSWFPLLGTYFM